PRHSVVHPVTTKAFFYPFILGSLLLNYWRSSIWAPECNNNLLALPDGQSGRQSHIHRPVRGFIPTSPQDHLPLHRVQCMSAAFKFQQTFRKDPY
ncbi:hypothetical protein BD309DRAFT_1042334, partial [Dichomitus squalens]